MLREISQNFFLKNYYFTQYLETKILVLTTMLSYELFLKNEVGHLRLLSWFLTKKTRQKKYYREKTEKKEFGAGITRLAS